MNGWRFAMTVLFAVMLSACGGTKEGSSHTQTRTSGPAPTHAAAPAPKRASDWPTYHLDLARGGFDAHAPAARGLLPAWSTPVDGKVYAEPVVAGALVVAATEKDSVYGLDVRTGRVRWRARLGAPVDGSDLPCGNIDPSGITGTPALDPHAGRLYVVAFVAPAHHVLAALSLQDGRTLWTRDIDPPGADPAVHQQRAALALSHGRVYVAYGGLFGDCGDYHGWVLGAPSSGPAGALESYKVPTNREGGIWAPSGPANDAGGDVFVATGNGDSTTSFDHGNAVIRLSSALREADYFAPADTAELNASDADLGAVGPLLLPGRRVFAIGKSGVGYLLNSDRLGGVGHPLASRHVCDGAFGGAAYAGGFIYVPCTDGVIALRTHARSLSVAWRGPSFRAGPPIVAGGSVFAVDLDGGALVVLDARSGRRRASQPLGEPPQFTTPSESAGRLFVSGGSRVLAFSGA